MAPAPPVHRPKACYHLNYGSWDEIYGPDERSAIDELVDLLPQERANNAIVPAPDREAETEILFTGWGHPKLDAARLERLPKLRLVLYGAGSIRRMVTEAFWERNIPVCSAWAANALPVAEFTLAQILLGLKRTLPMVRHIRKTREFLRLRPMPGNYKSTVGIVSLGMIGRLVRDNLRPFSHRVIAYDPFFSAESARKLDIELVSLEELFQRADAVTIHTPWLPETEGMISGDLIESMKECATLINTSRGAVINQPEMIEVLRRRSDLTAILDVAHPEPPAADSPLYELDNIFLTPHMAGSVDEECRRMGRYMVEECERFLRGEPLQWAITREQFQRMA